MKSYDEIADEYANKRLIGARTKELMKNPLFKNVAELYAQQRVNEVLEERNKLSEVLEEILSRNDVMKWHYNDLLRYNKALKLKNNEK